eukprot:6184958-Pleurochrysis_carterae.AAC.7
MTLALMKKACEAKAQQADADDNNTIQLTIHKCFNIVLSMATQEILVASPINFLRLVSTEERGCWRRCSKAGSERQCSEQAGRIGAVARGAARGRRGAGINDARACDDVRAGAASRTKLVITVPMLSGVMPETDEDGGEELELEQDDGGDDFEEDENEEEYPDHPHAAVSCRASRQRTTGFASDETLSALSANAGNLNGNVCLLLQCSEYQASPLPAHLRPASLHSYWRALLHTGCFSLLFHGFGCKRALLRSVVAPLGHNGKVFAHDDSLLRITVLIMHKDAQHILSINGCSSKSALRELLVKICEQVLWAGHAVVPCGCLGSDTHAHVPSCLGDFCMHCQPAVIGRN